MRIDNDPYTDEQRYNRLECFVDLMFQPLFREKAEVQFNRVKTFSIDQYQFYVGPLELYERTPQLVHFIVIRLTCYTFFALSAHYMGLVHTT